MKNRKRFHAGQLIVRQNRFPIELLENRDGVIPGIYLVLGVVDSLSDEEKFIDYESVVDEFETNIQYRMISPAGGIVCWNSSYMELRYKVIS